MKAPDSETEEPDASLIIVEDESLVAEDLRTLIEKIGFSVLDICRTGQEALESIHEKTPDLVLMDIRLDGDTDGIEVAQQINMSPPPVIFLTAHTDKNTLDRAKQANPLGYLTKPINEADLRTTLEVSKARKDTLRELRLKERAMSATREGITIARRGENEDPLIYVNDAFLTITGYDRDEVLGRDCRFLQGNGTDEEKVRKIRRALDNQESVSVELVNYRKDGERFWNRLSITPVRDELGTVTHYVGIQQDVTQYKEQEEKLRQSEKLAAIGEMAAGLMHEINNPNAFIQGNVEFVQKGWDKLQNIVQSAELDQDLEYILNELDDTLDAIEEGTHRIEDIVNKVKLFARRDSRKSDLQVFDPVPEIMMALDMEGSRDSDDVLTVESTVGEGDLRIEADPTEVKQLVTNITENALDAVGEVEDPEVTVRVDKEESDLKIEICDNGPGISEEDKQKIFDPFYTTKETGQGTGLGLSIVQGIVERADGSIEVDSEEGEGTRFLIRFPLRKNNNHEHP
jgi:PAS domain S-box-containing protein